MITMEVRGTVLVSVRAAIAKYHRLGRHCFLTVPDIGSPRARHQQGWFLVKSLSLASFPSVCIAGAPSVSKSLLLKRTQVSLDEGPANGLILT